jgi:phosphate transport system substrate-binding protein
LPAVSLLREDCPITNGLFIYERQTMRFSTITKAAVVAVAAVIAVAPSAVAYDLTGAGATSISNYLEKCKTTYQTATNDTISYSGGGSGTGKTAINAGIKDVAFSDSVNTAAPATVFHIPAAVWPIGIGYNLNTPKTKPLQFSVETLAKIFSGQITKWNDPAIVADNKRTREIPIYGAKGTDGKPTVKGYRTVNTTVSLPNRPITVIYRTGNSGTSNNFTSALNAGAPKIWTNKGNDSFVTSNPIDISTRSGAFTGVATSALVASTNSNTPDSISYNETGFISASPRLQTAYVINPAGKSVFPDADSANAAYAASTLDAATGILTWNYTSTAAAQYPFTAGTYAMVKTNYDDAAKSAAVKKFVEYFAFNCSADVTTEGMIKITKTSDLGKAITALAAKIK